jgi:hypothetical protein
MSLEGPLPGRCDDLLIDYNFGPSSGLVTSLYRWTPSAPDACANPLGAGSWGNATVVAGGLVQTASGANPELTPATANPSTFGEFAIDLTGAGVLPDNRCVTFTTGSTVTYTGNSTQASLKDILQYSNPIVLNNCGKISVAKVTEPAGFGAGQNFAYKLTQADGQAVHDSTLSVSGGGSDTDASNVSISSLIQTGQTHVWSNVLAQPDYQLQEVTLPANWQVKDISCTYWDPFYVSNGVVTPQLRTVSTTTAALGAIGIPSPQLKPAAQPNTSCTITNNTSGIRLVKAGSGDPNQTFTFSMTGQTVPALKLGSSADFAFAPGTSVSINETLPSTTPAWQLTKIECKLPNGDPVGTVSGTQVALQTVAGKVVTCTYTNDQKSRIVVSKAGTGSAAQTFPFEQSWDGNTTAPADFSLSIGQSTNSGDIAPGTYTVSELLPSTSPAWVLNNISCTDDAAGGNHSTSSIANPTATITLAAGDTVSCTFSNAQQGRLVLVKNTVGPDGTFSFSGPISSVTTTSNTGTVGLDVSPGTYPVAETVPAGWALTSASCDQGRTLPNVVINAGQTVTCTFNNTKLGKIVVTKQALPDGSPQQFTFDGSWSGVGTDLTLSDGQSGDSGFIAPGTYSVAETNIPAGWDLSSATCSDGSPITAISVAADETVTCTFTNTQRGTIVIVKNSGVAAGTFAFNQTWTSGTGVTTPFGITTVAPGNTGQQQFDNVAPGSYKVSETDPGAAVRRRREQRQHVVAVDPAAAGLGYGQRRSGRDSRVHVQQLQEGHDRHRQGRPAERSGRVRLHRIGATVELHHQRQWLTVLRQHHRDRGERHHLSGGRRHDTRLDARLDQLQQSSDSDGPRRAHSHHLGRAWRNGDVHVHQHRHPRKPVADQVGVGRRPHLSVELRLHLDTSRRSVRHQVVRRDRRQHHSCSDVDRSDTRPELHTRRGSRPGLELVDLVHLDGCRRIDHRQHGAAVHVHRPARRGHLVRGHQRSCAGHVERHEVGDRSRSRGGLGPVHGHADARGNAGQRRRVEGGSCGPVQWPRSWHDLHARRGVGPGMDGRHVLLLRDPRRIQHGDTGRRPAAVRAAR